MLPSSLSSHEDGYAVLAKGADVFLTIRASQQATEFGLQCNQRQLFAIAKRTAGRRYEGPPPPTITGGHPPCKLLCPLDRPPGGAPPLQQPHPAGRSRAPVAPRGHVAHG